MQVDGFGGSKSLRLDTRRADVTRFLGLIGWETGTSPHVPSTEKLRHLFTVALEEPIETLEAAGADPLMCAGLWTFTKNVIATIDARRCDLPKLADGCIDSQYVFEDVLVTAGIDGVPLWNEVARKNEAKVGGPKDPVTGKQLKPPGWTPPDIHGLLVAQGWRP